MGEFIGERLGVLSANRTPLMGELCVCLTHRPLTSRHRCDLPVGWSHLSTADCHLVHFSSTISFWISLFRSLSDSSAGFSPRFRSRSSASDLADADWVGWKCRMRPAGIMRPLALFTAFLKVFSACSTVLASPSSARYSVVVVVVDSSPHQSPRCGSSRIRSAQSI